MGKFLEKFGWLIGIAAAGIGVAVAASQKSSAPAANSGVDAKTGMPLSGATCKTPVDVPADALKRYTSNSGVTADDLAKLGWPFIAEAWLCYSQGYTDQGNYTKQNGEVFPSATAEIAAGYIPALKWPAANTTAAAKMLDPEFQVSYATSAQDVWAYYRDVLKAHGRPGVYAIP